MITARWGRDTISRLLDSIPNPGLPLPVCGVPERASFQGKGSFWST